jgi:hypothetical protein
MTSDRWASAAEGEGIVFDGLFSNWRDAVVFGLNYSSAQYGEAALAKAVKRGGSGKGLFGVDGAAQAGMILAAIERLGDTEASAIVARFAVRTEPCPCCGEDKKIGWSSGVHWDKKFWMANSECLRCGLGLTVEATTKEAAVRLAVRRWNRRAKP